MKPSRIALLAAVLVLCAPSSARAWGAVGHRVIIDRAIALLPPELKPFFEQHRHELLVRVNDPDTWRNVGWEDDPNHFLDFGVADYGAFPFAALPRDYDAALEKFGAATLKRNGLLPWRAAEMAGNLRRAFVSFTRQAPYASSDAVLFTAVTAHYIQDAHQPFHATINYDGQQTGQSGVHSRFERDLIERYESRLRLQPAPPIRMSSMRDFAFETLLASYQLVDSILKADKDAIGQKDAYDEAYFEAFFVAVQPIVERRLNESISATAGLIVSAWEAAGKPALPLKDVRPLQRRRR